VQRIETTESLPNSKGNEWVQIMREKAPLEERLITTYLRALKPDCFDHYRYRREPLMPRGYLEDYQDYQAVSLEKKPDAWRALSAKYAGYFKACQTAKSENDSDKKFLSEMLECFTRNNMPAQAEKVRIRLLEFGS